MLSNREELLNTAKTSQDQQELFNLLIVSIDQNFPDLGAYILHNAAFNLAVCFEDTSYRNAGRNILMMAAEHGASNTVLHIIRHSHFKSDWIKQEINNENAVNLAARNGHTRVLNTIVDYHPFYVYFAGFHTAIVSNQPRTALALLRHRQFPDKAFRNSTKMVFDYAAAAIIHNPAQQAGSCLELATEILQYHHPIAYDDLFGNEEKDPFLLAARYGNHKVISFIRLGEEFAGENRLPFIGEYTKALYLAGTNNHAETFQAILNHNFFHPYATEVLADERLAQAVAAASQEIQALYRNAKEKHARLAMLKKLIHSLPSTFDFPLEHLNVHLTLKNAYAQLINRNIKYPPHYQVEPFETEHAQKILEFLIGSIIVVLAHKDSRENKKHFNYPRSTYTELLDMFSPEAKQDLNPEQLSAFIHKIGKAAVNDRTMFNPTIIRNFKNVYADRFPKLCSEESINNLEYLLNATPRQANVSAFGRYENPEAKPLVNAYEQQEKSHKKYTMLVFISLIFPPALLITVPLWFYKKSQETVKKIPTTYAEAQTVKTVRQAFKAHLAANGLSPTVNPLKQRKYVTTENGQPVLYLTRDAANRYTHFAKLTSPLTGNALVQASKKGLYS